MFTIFLRDIYKAVSKLIISETKMKIYDSDFEEPITRPSFRMFMDTYKSEHYSFGIRDLKVYFNVYFYSEKGKYEIMDIQDKLSARFINPVHINRETSVYVDDLEFEKLPDNILNISFYFEIGLKFIDERDIEAMEILQQK